MMKIDELMKIDGDNDNDDDNDNDGNDGDDGNDNDNDVYAIPDLLNINMYAILIIMLLI